MLSLRSSGGKQIDDLMDGFVGAVICGLQFTGRLETVDSAVVETAVCERTAELFVEEEKEQRNLNAFWGEAVGVAGSIPLRQAMAFEFAQVVTQLVDAVACVGELEGAEDSLVDLLGGPATDVAAAVQEGLEEADDARIMQLDTGIADRADGDGEGETLRQLEVDMDIEPLCLAAGEAICDGLEPLAHGMEMIQSLPEMEIGEVVGDQLGIRANCVAPGPVYTPMVYARGMTEQARDTRRQASVLKREGTGWDIGGAVRFLLSDQARYITGQVLVVDGGATLVGPSRASQ